MKFTPTSLSALLLSTLPLTAGCQSRSLHEVRRHQPPLSASSALQAAEVALRTSWRLSTGIRGQGR